MAEHRREREGSRRQEESLARAQSIIPQNILTGTRGLCPTLMKKETRVEKVGSKQIYSKAPASCILLAGYSE